MNLIAAVDKNWAIGYRNKLLISIPDDMKYFREMTTGKVCVMGKNTLLSFPAGMPLANRENVVLTSDKSFRAKGAVVVHSVDEALKELEQYDSRDVFVIGGESIYKQFIEHMDTAYITYIDYKYQADKHRPNLEKDSNWKLVEESDEQTYFNVEYYFRKYVRK